MPEETRGGKIPATLCPERTCPVLSAIPGTQCWVHPDKRLKPSTEDDTCGNTFASLSPLGTHFPCGCSSPLRPTKNVTPTKPMFGASRTPPQCFRGTSQHVHSTQVHSFLGLLLLHLNHGLLEGRNLLCSS